VRALADHIRDVIRGSTPVDPPIRPVVLFPGWFVERQPKGVAVWVLNEKALLAFVREEPVCLNEDRVFARSLPHSIRMCATTRPRESRLKPSCADLARNDHVRQPPHPARNLSPL
jgi:hypothetical protein